MTVTSSSCESPTETQSPVVSGARSVSPPGQSSAALSVEQPFAEIPTRLHPGTCLGHYEIQEQLERGGQAVVYRAWDNRLQREVAIKLGHRSDEIHATGFSRIITEGKILAKIEHPCLPQVYDSGSHEDSPFLVIEFIRGQSLQRIADKSPLDRRQIVRFLDEISGAVAAAHNAGVLHLDLKPENVIVTPEGRCRLIDFGLAWRTETDAAGSPPLVAGTREYLSPEQAQGDPQRWTEATDVFGLGGILFQLLTGTTPLPAEPLDERGYAAHLNGLAEKLQAHKADPALSALCCTALACHPQDRFQSIENFRQALHGRRRATEKLLAGFFVLAGLILLCLGTDLWEVPVRTQNHRDFKDYSRGSLSLRESAFLNLRVEVQSEKMRAPHLMFWSPSLGFRELGGLKRTSFGDYYRWSPRCQSGVLTLRSADETFCIFALDGSLDLDDEQQTTLRHQLVALLSAMPTERLVPSRTGPVVLCTSRTRVSPDTARHPALRSRVEQLNQMLEELEVPFQWMLLTRCTQERPVWEVDLFFDLVEVPSNRQTSADTMLIN